VKRHIAVSSPASSANVGPGFDSFGLALASPRDLVYVEVEDGDGRVEVELSPSSEYSVPTTVEENSAGAVAKAALDRVGHKFNVKITLTKKIRPGCGLGSSGASAAGTAFALNTLLGLALTPEELVSLAAEGERAAAGAPHPDNVAASLLGGFTFVVSHRPLRLYRISPPRDLRLCVCYPLVDGAGEKKTQKMRSVIPRSVNLEDALWNVWHAAAVVAGFTLGDVELLGAGLDDAIVEKARSSLVPCYHEVKKAALEAGAEGVALSGAGPAMIGYIKLGRTDPSNVLRAMLEAYGAQGFKAHGFVTEPGAGCFEA